MDGGLVRSYRKERSSLKNNMDIHRLKALSDEDRRSVLQGEALNVEEQAYMRPLTEDELSVKKDELVQASIMKAVIEEEFKLTKDAFKARTEPLRSTITNTLVAVKNKAVETKGLVYKLADTDEQKIYFVDGLGNVISSRKMLPEERQLRFSVKLNQAM